MAPRHWNLPRGSGKGRLRWDVLRRGNEERRLERSERSEVAEGTTSVRRTGEKGASEPVGCERRRATTDTRNEEHSRSPCHLVTLSPCHLLTPQAACTSSRMTSAATMTTTPPRLRLAPLAE